MQRYIKFLFFMVIILLATNCFSLSGFRGFNKQIKSFYYDQIYCEKNYKPEGIRLIKKYFKYAVPICNNKKAAMQNAYAYYLNLARHGDGKAAYIVGVANVMGLSPDSVKFSKAVIVHWFKLYMKASRSRLLRIKAMSAVLTAIGMGYHYGLGVKKDINKALYYYREAALLNDPYAIKLLKIIH